MSSEPLKWLRSISDSLDQKEDFDYNVAMRRLVFVALVGCGVIVAYGSREGGSSVIAIGVMAAGAALLLGGLLGFLFGVPHARENGGVPSTDDPSGTPDEAAASKETLSEKYRPSTSLEQISDWLTKIIVGVGLVEIRQIFAKLIAMGDYIAPGLSKGAVPMQGARVFALAILAYFSVCGFVFGFLWARLYLPRWFAEADTVRRILSKLELQHEADAKALSLSNRLLTLTGEEHQVSELEVAKTIAAASRPIKTQIFSQAEVASEDKGNTDYQTRLKGAIAIYRALIADDTDERYHRNYSELSYALGRQKPPDWPGAEKAIDKAIKIRNGRRLQGWKYYEFRRARARIEADPQFLEGVPSTPEVIQKVRSDLEAAAKQADKWERWIREGGGVVQKWMDRNDVKVS